MALATGPRCKITVCFRLVSLGGLIREEHASAVTSWLVRSYKLLSFLVHLRITEIIHNIRYSAVTVFFTSHVKRN